ncbi:MAG: S-layer homology domain-containing protein [Firmicutes bacterium]|nr:S-layer homology domain-containing protein [Bacillota bacterium]
MKQRIKIIISLLTTVALVAVLLPASAMANTEEGYIYDGLGHSDTENGATWNYDYTNSSGNNGNLSDEQAYTITVDKNGGKPGSNWQDSFQIPQGFPFIVTDPSSPDEDFAYPPDGLEFLGVEVDGIKYEEGDAVPINGNTTIKLLWGNFITIDEVSVSFTVPVNDDLIWDVDENEYIVPEDGHYSIAARSFYFNNGTPFDDNSYFEEGYDYTLRVLLGADTGYIFKGGVKDTDGEAAPDVKDRVKYFMNGHDITENIVVPYLRKYVAAEYTFIVPYVIKLDTNGGKVSVEDIKVCKGDSIGKLPKPVRPGYRFDGWFTEIEEGDEVTSETKFNESTTIYAHWTKINSSGGGSSGTVSYVLKFETNGGNEVKSITDKAGTVINLSDYTPTKNEAVFEGWYSDEQLTSEVTSVTLNKNTTVYAKWSDSIESEPAPDHNNSSRNNNNSAKFKDVDPGKWYADEIDFAVSNNLMTGISENEFGPELSVTRGMIITTLYRMEGEPAVEGAVEFNDVAENTWYTNAIIWASKNGIASGYTDGSFKPGQTVSRQELAQFIYKYAEFKGLDLTAKGNIDIFTDKDDIGSWAVNAVEWAVGAGIINGMGNGTIAPDAISTRAQLASILMRLNALMPSAGKEPAEIVSE